MKKALILIFCLALLMLVACNNADTDTGSNQNSDIISDNLKDGQCLVSFDLNGGSGEAKAQIVNKGSYITEPAPPTKAGHLFAGWHLENKCWSFEYNTANENITLVAQYMVDDGFTFRGEGEECILVKYEGSLNQVRVPAYYNGMRVRGIEANAFKGNKQITQLYLPETIESIGICAFDDCSNIRIISLPISLRIIKNKAFKNCKGLQSISYNCAKVEDFSEFNMIFYNAGISSENGFNLVVGKYVEHLPNYLFDSKCNYSYMDREEYKNDVKIPKLTSVFFANESSCKSIGKNAFYDCDSLERVTLSDEITRIGSSCFSGCTSLEEIKLPKMIEEIEKFAFYSNTSLKTIKFPEQIISKNGINIGTYAFAKCNALIEIDLENNLVALGDNAFYQCASLERADLGDNITKIPFECFYECKRLKSVNLGSKLTAINMHAFYRCESLEISQLPSSLTLIGNSAFCECKSIEKITIPSSVTLMDSDVFEGCIRLKTAIVNANVKKLNGTFSGCSSLENVEISDTVTYMDSTFWGCRALKSIELPPNLEDLNYNVFNGCKSLKSIKLVPSIRTIDYGCFRDCDALEEIVLPSSLESIGGYAFANCDSLKKIWIPNTVSKLQYGIFEETPLVKIYAQPTQRPSGWEIGFETGTKGVLWGKESIN